MIRALFVDEPTQALEGLERRLRPLVDRWQMRFVGGGSAAMAALEDEPADIVVTEMKGSELDGADLLRRVRERWPSTVRLVLSGEIGQGGVMRALPVAHQYLTKPCDVGQLQLVVEQMQRLQGRIYSAGVLAAIGTVKSLPSVPRLFQQLTAELDGGEASPKSIAEIIEQDTAMTVRLLQLVNSTYFGLVRRIHHVRDAVTIIGFEPIRTLVASTELFRGMASMCAPGGFSLEALQRHSQRVGSVAASLLDAREQARTAFCAAMLHDVGETVLAVSMPERFAQSRALAAEQGCAVQDAEQQVFDCTHADVGAHVLTLWGLPQTLIESVAFHHQPGAIAEQPFGVAGAVHVADALVHENGRGEAQIRARIDCDYLRRVGKLDALPGWIAQHASAAAV
jgi:HD-like signal output (HDOD) protein